MRSFATLCAFLLVTGGATAAPPSYLLLDLGPASDNGVFLNDLGEATLVRDGRALRYSDDLGEEDLLAPGSVLSVGGINVHGQVSAAVRNAGSADILRLSPETGWQTISGSSGQEFTYTGPNDYGDVAVGDFVFGEYITSTERAGFGLPGWPDMDVYVRDINNRRQTVFNLFHDGYPPVGPISMVYTYPSGQQPVPGIRVALGANDLGDILTYEQIVHPDGTHTPIATFALPDISFVPKDLNNAGTVIVNGFDLSGAFQAGVVSSDGAFALKDLVESSRDWNLTYASSINNAGQIAGTGYVNGQRHAFRLTPANSVPEPATSLLLAVGVLPILARLRRRGRNRSAGSVAAF